MKQPFFNCSMNLKEAWKKLNLSLPRDPAKKRNTYIFLLCLLLSALFWLFTQLSRDSQAPFNQPLLLDYAGDEFIITAQSDSVVFFNLQATGARLVMMRLFGPRDTLRIEATDLPGIQRFGHNFHYLTRQDLSARLTRHFDAGQNVMNIRPDTVFVKLEPAKKRKLPVELNATISFEKRFDLYGEIQVEPDSLEIRGPESLLDTLTHLNTKKLNLQNLSETTIKAVPVYIPANFPPVEISVREVEVKVPVEEYTEGSAEISVEIECPEINNDFEVESIRLFPSEVRVVYVVSLKDYHHVDPEMFRAVVQCPPKDHRVGGRLEVELVEYPGMVRIQTIRPRSVEYIILQ